MKTLEYGAVSAYYNGDGGVRLQLGVFRPFSIVFLALIVSIFQTASLSDPCSDPDVYDQPWRNVGNGNHGQYGTDRCDQGVFQSDRWYKFMLESQPAVIPTACVKNYMCGARIGMRVDLEDQSLPVNVGDNVTASLCGAFDVLGKYDCCVLRNPVVITRCTSDILVYKFPEPIDRCPVAICAKRVEVPHPPSSVVQHGQDFEASSSPATVDTTEATSSTTMITTPNYLQNDEPFTDTTSAQTTTGRHSGSTSPVTSYETNSASQNPTDYTPINNGPSTDNTSKVSLMDAIFLTTHLTTPDTPMGDNDDRNSTSSIIITTPITVSSPGDDSVSSPSPSSSSSTFSPSSYYIDDNIDQNESAAFSTTPSPLPSLSSPSSPSSASSASSASSPPSTSPSTDDYPWSTPRNEPPTDSPNIPSTAPSTTPSSSASTSSYEATTPEWTQLVTPADTKTQITSQEDTAQTSTPASITEGTDDKIAQFEGSHDTVTKQSITDASSSSSSSPSSSSSSSSSSPPSTSTFSQTMPSEASSQPSTTEIAPPTSSSSSLPSSSTSSQSPPSQTSHPPIPPPPPPTTTSSSETTTTRAYNTDRTISILDALGTHSTDNTGSALPQTTSTSSSLPPSTSPSAPAVVVPEVVLPEVVMKEKIRLVFLGGNLTAFAIFENQVASLLRTFIMENADHGPDNVTGWVVVFDMKSFVPKGNRSTVLDMSLSHAMDEVSLDTFERRDFATFIETTSNLTLLMVCRPSEGCGEDPAELDQVIEEHASSSALGDNWTVLIIVFVVCGLLVMCMMIGLACAKCRHRGVYKADSRQDIKHLKENRPYCEGTPSPFTDHQITKDERQRGTSPTGSAMDGGAAGNLENSWVIPFEEENLYANENGIVAKKTEDTEF